MSTYLHEVEANTQAQYIPAPPVERVIERPSAVDAQPAIADEKESDAAWN